MGILNKLFGGADGIRETMIESYWKHVHLVQQGRIPASDSAHNLGLYGALGSRYAVRRTPRPEVVLWGELAPFLAMPEAEAVRALAEYVVYQEIPNQSQVKWLAERINAGLTSTNDKDIRQLAVLGLSNRVTWCSMLNEHTRGVLGDTRF